MIIWLLLEENNLVQTLFLYPTSLKWLIFWHNYSQFVYYFRKINKKVFPTTKIAPPLHFMWSICYKLTNVYSSGYIQKVGFFNFYTNPHLCIFIKLEDATNWKFSHTKKKSLPWPKTFLVLVLDFVWVEKVLLNPWLMVIVGLMFENIHCFHHHHTR